MRASAFPGVVTDDVMCYYSQTSVEARKPGPAGAQ